MDNTEFLYCGYNTKRNDFSQNESNYGFEYDAYPQNLHSMESNLQDFSNPFFQTLNSKGKENPFQVIKNPKPLQTSKSFHSNNHYQHNFNEDNASISFQNSKDEAMYNPFQQQQQNGLNILNVESSIPHFAHEIEFKAEFMKDLKEEETLGYKKMNIEENKLLKNMNEESFFILIRAFPAINKFLLLQKQNQIFLQSKNFSLRENMTSINNINPITLDDLNNLTTFYYSMFPSANPDKCLNIQSIDVQELIRNSVDDDDDDESLLLLSHENKREYVEKNEEFKYMVNDLMIISQAQNFGCLML
jgi:hypothetical protein